MMSVGIAAQDLLHTEQLVTCNIVEQLVVPGEELAVQGYGCGVDAHKSRQEAGAPHSAPHCVTCSPHWVPQSML